MLGGIAGLFVIGFEDTTPEPVDFDDTVTVGLTLEDELRLDSEDESVELPRAQVFYSQYPYVVGYYGVEQFIHDQDEPAHEQQFGYPAMVYVTVYDESVTLTEEGYPTLDETTDWHDAEEAIYVAGSGATTPAGETVIPFTNEEQANSFSDRYGGEVLTWSEVVDTSFEIDDATTVRDRTAEQHRTADHLVDEATTLLDRPERTVVGEDVETIQEGIETAPPNSTVVVPDGLYTEEIEIDRPITVEGAGNAQITGDGNGTVVRVTADRAAISNVRISGVGSETPGSAATEGYVETDDQGHDHGTDDESVTEEDDDVWDATIEDAYARGDAGIAVDEANQTLVEEVTIYTPASGVMLRDSPNTVVRNSTVVGNADQIDAHMGVVAMRSPGVIENSSFEQGLDGVYTHRSDDAVIRNNTMTDNRMGVHLMHTSNALVADNEITEQDSAGIFVMTGPEKNGLVGNNIQQSSTGIDIGGTDSYVADNKLIRNDIGLRIESDSSIYERNVIAENEVGATSWSLLPTNRVTQNDFVSNEQHVTQSMGPVQIWTHDGVGNYWEGAVGKTDGTVLDRQYTPTDEVDAQLHRTDGTSTIAQAPALAAVSGFEETMSGMRDGEIIDRAPRCEPANTEWFEQQNKTSLEPTCGEGQ